MKNKDTYTLNLQVTPDLKEYMKKCLDELVKTRDDFYNDLIDEIDSMFDGISKHLDDIEDSIDKLADEINNMKENNKV